MSGFHRYVLQQTQYVSFALFTTHSVKPSDDNIVYSSTTEVGHRTPAEGAAVVTWLATLPESGPTGGFYCDYPPYSDKSGEFKVLQW